MNDKFLTLLGFAAKSGNLSFGMTACISAVCSGKSKLILICNDISEKSAKEIKFKAQKFSVKVIELDDYDMMTVSHSVGRKSGILSMNDSSFADAVLKTINKSKRGGNADEK